ncbi:hypothetical protein DPX16_17835 [Anabarilius grahami]|uniref:Uncharacterized protein n=1 Tax=Anabarilius grahami TaxID=495550 RepID=A0A3N0YHJ7_ANAGA|nr:hypothetical protein DPX16_17835 [Anabarilius grahami]
MFVRSLFGVLVLCPVFARVTCSLDWISRRCFLLPVSSLDRSLVFTHGLHGTASRTHFTSHDSSDLSSPIEVPASPLSCGVCCVIPVTDRWVSDAKYCSFTQYAKAKKDLFEHLGLDKNDSQNIRMWPLTFNYYYEDYYYEFSPTNNTEFNPANNTEFNPANNTEFHPANNTEFNPANNTEFNPTDYPDDYPTFFSAIILVDLYVTSIINVV